MTTNTASADREPFPFHQLSAFIDGIAAIAADRKAASNDDAKAEAPTQESPEPEAQAATSTAALTEDAATLALFLLGNFCDHVVRPDLKERSPMITAIRIITELSEQLAEQLENPTVETSTGDRVDADDVIDSLIEESAGKTAVIDFLSAKLGLDS